MFTRKLLALFMAAVSVLGAVGLAAAAEVDCDSVYCFSAEDFSDEEKLTGICITGLPERSIGTVMLGTRILRPGDILTADQVAKMTFCPLRSEEDQTASVSYLPVFENRVAPSATMTISIRGKEDKAPAAEDFAAETYKNLPLEGKLKVSDPEGQKMTFTVTRKPKRGEVAVQEDGSFTYTPKKNKVGIDSFTYTAVDSAGNVSREATVTITIMKPTDAPQYTDTVGESCRFAAEWMKNTGIFVGEKVVGNACFSPEKEVTRGEFVTMLVKALKIPTEKDASVTGYTEDVPGWLKPYLAAALRSGLLDGVPGGEVFRYDEGIPQAEAAVMLQNALDLAAPSEEAVMSEGDTTPEWAVFSLKALNANGISLTAEGNLTRAKAAETLYQASLLADSAPGMAVIRKQR